MMTDKEKEGGAREELRDKVIHTALEAFQKNGIRSITMDDIAALLKISKRTLYEIFADKETLLKECILQHQQMAQKALTQLVARSSNVLEVILTCYQGSVEMYRKVDKRFFDDMKKYPKVYAMLKANREQDNKVVIDFLKKGVEQGLFRQDINFEIIHFLLREQLDLLLAEKALNEFPFLEVYESIMLTYLRGISTAEGNRELDEFVVRYRKQMSEETTE